MTSFSVFNFCPVRSLKIKENQALISLYVLVCFKLHLIVIIYCIFYNFLNCLRFLLIQPEFGIRKRRKILSNMKRRFFGLMTVGNETTKNIDTKIEGTTMARMFDLRNILQLVNNRFNNGAPSRKKLILK